MLKRIAVIGEASLDETLVSAAQEAGVQLKTMTPADAVPPGSTALLGPAEASTLSAALAHATAHEGLLRIIAEAVDSREGLVHGSGARLCEHATRFAQALGLSEDEQYALERGALLHDVGKILLNNDVLMKKSVLDYDDWLLLQAHTTMGANLLLESKCHTDVVDIVRYHHECWNGEGYPEGLEKDAIPTLALIMKILDVYCAMTSPRHYRSSHASHEDAIAHLKEERGERYHAELVDAFIEHKIGKPFSNR
mgnify:CR=1 FL=1